MPTWWDERRFGIFVHATLATVPAWSPIGQYAEWYRSHLGEPVEDALLQPQPLPEVLAHHRDRWGHVERYDDFAELLSFDRFDAEEWASLVREAGAGYTVFVSKHHDGWAWWDAPGSSKRLTEVGPRRNVLAEYAAACERNDVVFGTYLSLLDWGDDRYPDDEYVSSALHPQAVDLVQRYGSAILWGDGHWGHGPDRWRTAELLDRVRAIDPTVIVNDRWHASSTVPDGSPPILRTFEYDTPTDILDGPWELTRGIGASFGHNRAEGPEHHLRGDQIIDLYTDVVAKGGHLLLNIGPAADGTIPELQARPLREAGEWIRRHADLLGRSRPWTTWGDEDVRYVDVDGRIVAIDLTGRGRFAALGNDDHDVTGVESVDGGADVPLTWSASPQGLQVDRIGAPPQPGPAVYVVTARPHREGARLFTLDSPDAVPLAPLLDGAASGDIVQLGDGVYHGPAVVPPGVILRGLGAARTTIVNTESTGIVPDPATVALRRNARIEHVRIEGTGGPTASWRRPPIVSLDEPFATVLGCEVAGAIAVTADEAVIRATRARSIRSRGAEGLLVSRCTLRGTRWDVGVHVTGGSRHEVESCDIADHLCGVRFSDTIDSVVRGNRLTSRWWAVHARGTERVHVHGNRIEHTMRAVDIDGGSGACVDGNAVTNGDSGCLVQAGATDVIVAGNHWQGCRAGLITWAADPLHRENVGVDLLDPDAAHVSGP